MSYKSRGSYKSFCIRDCSNRSESCDYCIRYSHYRPNKEQDELKKARDFLKGR